ncbi:unnamed protein product, partial [Rotaria sp. Silwood2]
VLFILDLNNFTKF